jgi:hypothetical protein
MCALETQNDCGARLQKDFMSSNLFHTFSKSDNSKEAKIQDSAQDKAAKYIKARGPFADR